MARQGQEPRRLRYAQDHWLRHGRTSEALRAYLDQQSKAYSRVKNHFVGQLLGNLAGRQVLDYGCGGGYFLRWALLHGAAGVVGVDAEPGALDIAQMLLRGQGLAQGWDLLLADTFPEFPAGPGFGVILLKDVLEHVPDDLDLLRRAARCLAPGGSLVLATQNSLSLNFLLEGGYRRWLRGHKHWMGWDPTHLRFYTPGRLRRLLARAGLTACAWRSTYLLPHKLPPLPWRPGRYTKIESLARLDLLWGDVFPFSRLGWSLMVKARV
jgi:2-polyprenyl-6-hydroxyphenyl methylase/3-demethylubiquinone-9 3-methyltransferase